MTRIRALREDERGFTLPEVLITTILLGILLTIATSTWFGVVESRNVDSATNQLAADLRLAHTGASNRLIEYRIAYVSGGDINCLGINADYCLLRQSGGTYQRVAVGFLPERTMISTASLNPDSTISTLLATPDTRTIKFNTNGTAESGGGLSAGVSELRLTVASDDSSPSHVVDVNPATSRIEIGP